MLHEDVHIAQRRVHCTEMYILHEDVHTAHRCRGRICCSEASAHLAHNHTHLLPRLLLPFTSTQPHPHSAAARHRHRLTRSCPHTPTNPTTLVSTPIQPAKDKHSHTKPHTHIAIMEFIKSVSFSQKRNKQTQTLRSRAQIHGETQTRTPASHARAYTNTYTETEIRERAHKRTLTERKPSRVRPPHQHLTDWKAQLGDAVRNLGWSVLNAHYDFFV